MPVGAFEAPTEKMNVLRTDPMLGHITTFGGHPVCCAAGLAALEYLEETGLVDEAERKGLRFEERLKRHPLVRGIRRAVGLLLAVETGESRIALGLIRDFVEAGLLPDSFLWCDTAFRIAPPLIITDEQIDETCDIVLRCLDAYR